jgi:truncated hemoglobin YjbI
MLDAAKNLAKDPKWRTRVIEQPEVWGLESITGDALVIRLVMKTRANAKDDVARELRMRLKRAIDDLGVTLPSMNSMTLTGLEGAQRVRGANPPKTKPTPVTSADGVVWKPKRGTKATNAKAGPATAPTPERPVPRRKGRTNDGCRSLSFYEEVGGHDTFVRLVDIFYRGVAADEVLADVPRGGSARGRAPHDVPRAVLGRTDDLQRATRAPGLRMRHMPFHVNPDARDRWLRTCAPRSTSRPPLHEATLWDYLAARRACDGEHVRTDGIGPERTSTASDATGPP